MTPNILEIKLDVMNRLTEFLNSVCVVDTECTHADPDQAEIVELGVAEHDATTDTWHVKQELFGSMQPMPPAASAVTGISRAMIDQLPTFDQHADLVLRMLNLDKPIWVAHNAQYDRKVLNRALQAVDSELATWVDQNVIWLCTLRLSRHVWPHAESHAQAYLRYWLDLPVPDSVGVHRAGADVHTCAALLTRICEELVIQKRLMPDQPWIPQLEKICTSAVPIHTWPWGKHKGEPLAQLSTDYMLWCVENMRQLNPDHEDWDFDMYENVRQELERRLEDSESTDE